MKPKLTNKQWSNLARLTIFCHENFKKIEKNFSMRQFVYTDEMGGSNIIGDISPPKLSKNECGTTACFCGWGPKAGVEAQLEEGWFDYAKRSFGADFHSANTQGKFFNWIFSSDWDDDSEYESPLRRAIKRAAWILMGYKIPDDDTNDDFLAFWEPDYDYIKTLI